ncbi:TPA_asm: hypothetical protein GI589_17800, partial [Salmonella enterica]|nr:hypothetical protein [Salmonella enterica subsp. enterica serovar Enteritidis]HAB1508374.1 hypothetical protein [Salmonella enterica]
CHFGPGQCSKSSRTTCTLRFLRAVRVQTGCANNAWWDRLLVRIRCLPHYATRICFTESYGVKQSRRGERQVAYKVNGSASRQAGNFSR